MEDKILKGPLTFSKNSFSHYVCVLVCLKLTSYTFAEKQLNVNQPKFKTEHNIASHTLSKFKTNDFTRKNNFFTVEINTF